MTKQEYYKELEAKSMAELRKLAKQAAQGTCIKVNRMQSTYALINFLVEQKFSTVE